MSQPRKRNSAKNLGRNYLLDSELQAILRVAQQTETPIRDQALVMTSFRHGLRVSEAVALEWRQLDFNNYQLHIQRLKNGKPSVHPVQGDEARLLRKLNRQTKNSPYLFPGRGKKHLSDRQARKIFKKLGELAGLDFPVHFHQLRHSCGFHLANKGIDTRLIQDWLGHQNIQHTVLYTALSPERFKAIEF